MEKTALPLPEPQKAALIALWNAKATFGTLAILREFFGNDLDLAKVAFTIALRTRPDFFNEPEENFTKITGDRNYFLSTNLSTTIYEISKYSGIDRATVRRKLKKLEALGFVEKTENGQWSLINFLKDDTSHAAMTIKSLFKSYLKATASLLEIISLDDINKILTSLDGVPEQTSDALTSDEVGKKLSSEFNSARLDVA